MNKLRISLTEKEEGEIKGKIEADGDSLFVFECLLESLKPWPMRASWTLVNWSGTCMGG